jgi:hypothetical protein
VSIPLLSIVIAAEAGPKGLEDCLEVLAPQRGAATEVIVVGSCPCPPGLARRIPWLLWHEASGDLLVPQLWGLGVARARGEVVAITTASFLPGPTWVPALLEAHARSSAAAIGGPIAAPPARAGWIDWAIYFLRYSAYLGQGPAREVADLPGDNASYKRSALEGVDSWEGGFWEAELHRALRARGERLMLLPELAIQQAASAELWRFLRQRFRHGTHFGRSRCRGWSLPARLVAAGAFPALALLFFGKIAGRVARSRRDGGAFLGCLPVLACFLLAWSLGEAWGYLTAISRDRIRLSLGGTCRD